MSTLNYSVPAIATFERRKTLPPGHPLCAAAKASSIPERADQLARLHRGLQSGRATNASCFRLQRSSLDYSLRATANHQGQLVVVPVAET